MPLSTTPPRRWIRQTLGALVPMRIGPLAQAAMRSLAVAVSESQAPQVCDFDDLELATVILDDAPQYRCGSSSINGRGHGAWALAIQGHYDEAWNLYLPLIGLAQKILDGRFAAEIPIGQLLMLLWLALKRGALQEAYLAQRLVSRNGRRLNKTMQDDFKAMTQELLARGRGIRPVPVLIAEC